MPSNERQIDRMKASLFGMCVGDALAMPVHWFYSPTKMGLDYPVADMHATGMMAPKATHAESMLQGMSYEGSIDILHDKAVYYQGHKAVSASAVKRASLYDDHGNFVGATARERIHYHQSLEKGQNTVTVCIARLLIRTLTRRNGEHADSYQPDSFLQDYMAYMITRPPPKSSPAYELTQVHYHNDTYLDIATKRFFEYASQGIPLHKCAYRDRDQWSVGALDGVVYCLPIVFAYAHEPIPFIIGRTVEQQMLTHRSVTVTAVLTVLIPLLIDLWSGKMELRPALQRAMESLKPPRITGRKMRDSYVDHRGPGRIPKQEKWEQHMQFDDSETTWDLVSRMLEQGIDDKDVAGWGDQPNSRLSTACYSEQAFTIVLYLAYKYHDDAQAALVANARLGGHSTARGAVLGSILGASGLSMPFTEHLEAKRVLDEEFSSFLGTVAI